MVSGFFFALIAAAFIYKLGYDAGRRKGLNENEQVIDAIQYPRGCSCIRNALMPSAACPHHGKSA